MVAVASPAWRDNRRFVRVAVLGWLLLSAIGAWLRVTHAGDAADAWRTDADGSARLHVNVIGWGTGWGAVLALVALAVVVVVTWRLARAHALLGRPRSSWGPGWAVAGRVIPLANVVLPLLQLDELWRGSAPGTPRGTPAWRANPRTRLIHFGLAMSIAATTLGMIAFVRVFSTVATSFAELRQRGTGNAIADAIEAAQPWTVGAEIAQLLTAAVVAVLLLRIAERQQRLHESDPGPDVRAAAHPWQATFPAGWFADPYGRYPMRWWDGTTWTAHVFASGARELDASGASPAPPSTVG